MYEEVEMNVCKVCERSRGGRDREKNCNYFLFHLIHREQPPFCFYYNFRNFPRRIMSFSLVCYHDFTHTRAPKKKKKRPHTKSNSKDPNGSPSAIRSKIESSG